MTASPNPNADRMNVATKTTASTQVVNQTYPISTPGGRVLVVHFVVAVHGDPGSTNANKPVSRWRTTCCKFSARPKSFR